MNELKGFGSIRFYLGTAAEWAASTKKLAVNEIAIITDEPYRYKQGIGTVWLGTPGAPSNGVPFAQLPYYQAAGTYSYAEGLTAHAGGGQGSALVLGAEFNVVSTVATANDSVSLAPAQTGLQQTVTNNGANTLAVFPASGDIIDAQAVNTPFYLAPGASKTFTASNATNWASSASPVATTLQPVAINATAVATAAQIASKMITSTSAAATSITLPTATLLAQFLGAKEGTEFTFWIDNTAGANTVTIVAGAGMTALTTITGENTLTIPSGSAGKFLLFFKSGVAALLARTV